MVVAVVMIATSNILSILDCLDLSRVCSSQQSHPLFPWCWFSLHTIRIACAYPCVCCVFKIKSGSSHFFDDAITNIQHICVLCVYFLFSRLNSFEIHVFGCPQSKRINFHLMFCRICMNVRCRLSPIIKNLHTHTYFIEIWEKNEYKQYLALDCESCKSCRCKIREENFWVKAKFE